MIQCVVFGCFLKRLLLQAIVALVDKLIKI